ncbi:MAG: histidine kinase [Ardenticatenia bacterium]|nr:histidine kinase [Ardenticatenia bacterium]
MLSALRLRLTLLYLAIGLAFLLLVGAGSYGLLRGYYASSTDLALQHRLVGELRLLGMSVPPDLAAADRAWYASRGRSAPLPTPTGAARPAGSETEDRDDDGESESGEDGSGEASAGRASTAPEVEEAHADESAAEEAFDGDLAIIFVRPLDAAGRPLAGATSDRPLPSSLASPAGVAAAKVLGSDRRTVRAADGSGVRLLTFRLASGSGADPVFLQLGRPLDDQERVLRRLLAVLLSLGSLSAVLLGGGGWWLAGRSLQPAERAWRQQQAFVANASHELRTPLTLIRASAEVLGRSLPATGDDRSLIDDILSECDHTSRLVGDLLLLSRLDSVQLELRREPVPLTALFADLARQFGRLAAAREVVFQIENGGGAGGAPLLVQADPTRLRQVLLALLDNALRHTPPGGSISLAAWHDGGLALNDGGRHWDRSLPGTRLPVAIVVSDSGEGIAAEDLPHVFERFYRAGASGGAGGEGGAGLGLALAKALVEAQGGRMAIESQQGLGTRVTIGLPGPA